MTAPAFQAAYRRASSSARSRRARCHQPIQRSVNPAQTVARIDMPLAGNGEDATSRRRAADAAERRDPAGARQARRRDASAVTGETAGTHDFNQTMKRRIPLVFAFVLGLAFLLLLVTFRSIVVPIKAICLNLLSVGAAYGVLVWIFQEGHLQGVLDFHSNGAIVTWLPLFLFTVLFGLSMDYHVFILSRDQGARRPRRADREGGRARHPARRRARSRGRARDGRGVRDLRVAAHARHQAARASASRSRCCSTRRSSAASCSRRR